MLAAALPVVAGETFESGNLKGGSGWSSEWAASGNVYVRTDGDPAEGSYHLRVRMGSRLERSVDLTGATAASLSFRAQVSGFEGVDSARVLVSRDGSSWTTLTTFTATQSDGVYRSYEYDLSAWAGAPVTIAFATSLDYYNDTLYLDQIEVLAGTGSTPDGTAPAVRVLGPNGGESLAAGSVRTVTWSATDAEGVTSVDVYYSANGGTSYSLVAAGLANSGSYAWTVPAAATTGGRIRVVARDAAGNSGADASDANFSITAASSSVLASEGFESRNLAGGSGWTSAWSASGNVYVRSDDGPSAGGYHLRVRMASRLERTVDLSGAGSATLRLQAKLEGLEGADAARVLASSDGVTWVTLATLTASQSDGVYRPLQYDLSAFAGRPVTIAFTTNFDYYNDTLYLDQIEVVTGGSATIFTDSLVDSGATQVTTLAPNGPVRGAAVDPVSVQGQGASSVRDRRSAPGDRAGSVDSASGIHRADERASLGLESVFADELLGELLTTAS